MGIAFGKDWKHVTKDGLTWRLAVPADLPRLREIWAEMDARAGVQDKPNLFEMPVVLTLVCEDASGVVISGIYGEAVIDFTMIGLDRRAARSIDEFWPTLHQFLFERTIRVARMLVPHRIAKHMGKLFPQMNEITQLVAQFVCIIRV